MLQKESDPSKHDIVAILLQDMLEVVTHDMMVNEIRYMNMIFAPLNELKYEIIYA